MIKLTKAEKPSVLVQNAEQWTKEYLQCIKKGKITDQVKYRYRDPEIKQALIKETHGKCAFCESKMLHVSPADIEHILPKNPDARPDLYVEWTNLTLSCEYCNRTGKRDYYDPDAPLINPYSDDPNMHFIAIGAFVRHKAYDQRAYITEKILELNRSELLEKRKERIDQIETLVVIWEKEQSSTLKQIAENELIKECSNDKEYYFIVKAYLTLRGVPI